MTRYDDATARARFDACGYGKAYEYVNVDGDRFTARCRACGHEFTRDNAILRKPQKKLRCPVCHERNVDAMLERYAAGCTSWECADEFGMTVAQVQSYASKRGVHGGMSKAESARRLRERNGGAKGNAMQRQRAEERRRESLTRRGFTLLDAWKGQGGVNRVGCGACGHVLVLSGAVVYKNKFTCPNCKRIGKQREENERLRLREQEARDRARKRAELKAERDAGIYAPQTATCRHCGKVWTFYPSREKYGRKNAPPYCSHRCQVKHNKQPSNIGHRLRKHGSGEAPRDKIMLRDLYERDGGVCQICGEPTDWNDYTRDAAGRFAYINGRYPTCDHVVPIAKGGTHTWDNVQLAHRDCNSIKRDRLPDENVTRG